MQLSSSISVSTALEWQAYCSSCKTAHGLPYQQALPAAQWLMQRLMQQGTMAVFDSQPSTKTLATQRLFGQERGKMFGVLKCRDRENQQTFLYAFSGQFAGSWQIDGWCPPLFDVNRFETLCEPLEKRIKAIGADLRAQSDPNQRQALQAKRKALSQRLMKDIHQLYRVHNSRATVTSLERACQRRSGGIPTGTGDCCAPKLLNQAARAQLTPISLVEFFFGKTNKSATRKHGHCYPPCADKCLPLLGYMLCR